MRPCILALVSLLLLLPAAAALVEPSAFGTTPYSDDKMTSPQTVPGKASRLTDRVECRLG